MIDALTRPAAESLLRQPGAAAAAGCILYLACLVPAIRLWLTGVPGSRQRSYWLIVAAALMSAGIVEALGLPAQLTQIIRAWSVAQGWYAERWGPQIDGIIAICAVYLAGLIILKPLIPPGSNSVAVFRSIMLLLMFITIRTVSLHELDSLLRMTIAWQVTFNDLAEGGLLFLVFWRVLRAHRMSFDRLRA